MHSELQAVCVSELKKVHLNTIWKNIYLSKWCRLHAFQTHYLISIVSYRRQTVRFLYWRNDIWKVFFALFTFLTKSVVPLRNFSHSRCLWGFVTHIKYSLLFEFEFLRVCFFHENFHLKRKMKSRFFASFTNFDSISKSYTRHLIFHYLIRFFLSFVSNKGYQ